MRNVGGLFRTQGIKFGFESSEPCYSSVAGLWAVLTERFLVTGTSSVTNVGSTKDKLTQPQDSYFLWFCFEEA
jgi:hypothetical protein